MEEWKTSDANPQPLRGIQEDWQLAAGAWEGRAWSGAWEGPAEGGACVICWSYVHSYTHVSLQDSCSDVKLVVRDGVLML